MSAIDRRTVSLPAEQAAFIDTQVALGSYGSTSDVVSEALRALEERDASVERWLYDEVLPVLDAMTADPSRGLSADQVFADLRAHHAKRVHGSR